MVMQLLCKNKISSSIGTIKGQIPGVDDQIWPTITQILANQIKIGSKEGL
jgi:hypothetical protein